MRCAAGRAGRLTGGRESMAVFPYVVCLAAAFCAAQGDAEVSRPLVNTVPGRVVAWGANEYGQCDAPDGLTNAVAVAAGESHTVALRADGTVLAWGRNVQGECDVPSGLSNVVSVAAGSLHTVAVKADGSVEVWGADWSGQCQVPLGLTGVVAVAAGGDHCAALRSDGSVVAWGNNYFGQCSVPSGASNVAALAAGYGFTVALRRDGALITWGERSDDFIPQVTSVTSAVALAAGGSHVVVLGADGKVFAWSDRHYDLRTVPAGMLAGTAIASGAAHALLALEDNTVVAWGHNGGGQCDVPPEIGAAVALAGGGSHSVAVVVETVALPKFSPASGTILSSGERLEVSITCATSGAEIRYALDGSVPTAASPLYVAPLVVSAPAVVRARAFAAGLAPSGVAKGYYSVVPGAQRSGVVRVFGANGAGQCDVPAGLSNVVAVSAGYDFTAALKADGTVIAWGRQDGRACEVPADLSDVVALSAGEYHTLALRADGTVVAWGNNDLGQCTVPAGLCGVVSVSAGSAHSLALKSDGTVVAWGTDYWGQCTPPFPLSGIRAVAAGQQHSLALREDGTVVGWGENAGGECDSPEGLRDVVAITVGAHWSAALKADGTVFQWGDERSGAFVVPSGLTGVVSLSGGKKDGLVALKSDGTVVGWSNLLYDESGRYAFPAGLDHVAAVAAGQTHTAVLIGNAGEEAWLALEPGDRAVAARAGTVSYDVTCTGRSVRWNASVVSGAWARVVSVVAGTHGGVVTVAYDANVEGQPARQVAVRVSGPDWTTSGGHATLTQAAAVTKPLEAFVASQPQGVPFRTARGAWFHSDVEGAGALRSVVPPKGGSATLAATVLGPGLLTVDWKMSPSPNVTGGALTLSLAFKEVEKCAATGDFERLTLAVPGGVQTVLWNLRRGQSAGEVHGWVRDVTWQPLPAVPAESAAPRDASTLRGGRVPGLAWGEVAFPDGAACGYRLHAGSSMSFLRPVCESDVAFVPKGRVATLLSGAGERSLFWRIDTYVRDERGGEAVAKGRLWRFTALPDDAPQFVAALTDGTSEAVDELPPVTLYAGVASALGPYPVERSPMSAQVTVSAANLPQGLRVGFAEGRGVTLSGVAVSSAAGSAGRTYCAVLRLMEVQNRQTRRGATAELPAQVLPLGQACGTFTGFVDDGLTRRGLAMMTVQPSGKISGRVKAGIANYVFSAPSYGGITNGRFYAHMVAKADRVTTPRECPVDIEVSPDGAVSCLFDGCSSILFLERNRWKEPEMARVAKERFEGYYTVALSRSDGTTDDAMPSGTGYLTLTISAAGEVSVAGVLADGVAVSGTTTLLYDGVADIAWLPVFLVPSAYRYAGSGLFLILEIARGPASEDGPEGRTQNSVSGFGVWSNRDPLCIAGYHAGITSSQLGFSEEVAACGGYYDKKLNLQAYYEGRPFVFSAPSPFPRPFDWGGSGGASGFVLDAMPSGLEMPLTLPTASAEKYILLPPKDVAVPGAAPSSPVNPWAVRLTALRATGVLNGSFNLLFTNDEKGLQKSRTVPLKGILIPHAVGARYSGDQAAGFYLIQDTGSYTDAQGLKRSYPFNWSRGFSLSL